MRSWTIGILVLFVLFALTACAAPQPSGGEETLLVNGESGGLQEPPAFDPLVPASQAVDPQWFSDAAFVGDSVSVMLELYNSSAGLLGTPAFFCAESLSQTNALSYTAGNVHLPEYPKGSGQRPAVADGVSSSGAKKVYLMLGMNCISRGVDRACQDLVTLVGEILTRSPDTAILIESVTPMTADSPRADDALNLSLIHI